MAKTLADKIINSANGLHRSKSTEEAIFFFKINEDLRTMVGYSLTESRWVYPRVELAEEYLEITPNDLDPDEGFDYACLDPEVQKKIDERIRYEDSTTLYLNRGERPNLTESAAQLVKGARFGIFKEALDSGRGEIPED